MPDVGTKFDLDIVGHYFALIVKRTIILLGLTLCACNSSSGGAYYANLDGSATTEPKFDTDRSV